MNQKKRKSRIWLIIILFYLLIFYGGFLFANIRLINFINQFDRKKGWTYVVYYRDWQTRERSEKELEDYFFHYGHVYQFSIAEQKIAEQFEVDERIEYFAVCDEYLFLATDTDTNFEPVKIWRYDREAKKYELFGESGFYPFYVLTVYDGFLIYGGGDDVCVCSVDGNLETDSVSLKALFTEEIPQNRLWTAKWGDWRVGCLGRSGGNSFAMIDYIVNEKNGDVIWAENRPDDGWYSVDGRFLRLTTDGDRFYYQWEDEEKKHLIECLKGDVYERSQLFAGDLYMEDGRLIGLLTVSRNPRTGACLSQEDVRRDVLFELNPEEHTSEILYSTPNNRTRILGYRGGKVYLLKDSVICRESLTGEDREQLYDLGEEKWYVYDKENKHRRIDFDWRGDNLLIWTMVDKEMWIKSICVADGQEGTETELAKDCREAHTAAEHIYQWTGQEESDRRFQTKEIFAYDDEKVAADEEELRELVAVWLEENGFGGRTPTGTVEENQDGWARLDYYVDEQEQKYCFILWNVSDRDGKLIAANCAAKSLADAEYKGAVLCEQDKMSGVTREREYDERGRKRAEVSYRYREGVVFPFITEGWNLGDGEFLCRNQMMTFLEAYSLFDDTEKFAGTREILQDEREGLLCPLVPYLPYNCTCIYGEDGRLETLKEELQEYDIEMEWGWWRDSVDYSGRLDFQYRADGTPRRVDYLASEYAHGTYKSNGVIEYDEQGRMLSDSFYTTHGGDWYLYLYRGNEERPWARIDECSFVSSGFEAVTVFMPEGTGNTEVETVEYQSE